jgi:hypothetical protein
MDDLPERPTYVYVSEVSHHVGDLAYAFGGGLCSDIRQPGVATAALVGATWSEARANAVEYLKDVDQIIDYHALLRPGSRCRVGDSVLFGFRPQMQMTRSYIAPVSGLSGGGEARVHYLFDHANTALDERYEPVDAAEVRRDIEGLL